MVVFRHKLKKLEFEFKIKLNGKKLFPTNSVKYLDTEIDKQFNWVNPINEVAKPNRANAMLPKVREYVSTNALKSLSYAIFGSNLN